MEILPAIDLRDGKCVRLLRGDFASETVYDDDPVARARSFEEAGARLIHVVDLDAARTGEPVNLATVQAVCRAVSCAVEVGGGVRTAADAHRLLDAGAARVVVGTAAVEHPELVEELVADAPARVAVGLDARDGRVAVRGWTTASGLDVLEAARRFDRAGAAALIVTSIPRDGTMQGPDLPLLRAVLEATTTDVVASGGVGSLADLRLLGSLRAGGRGVAGAVVGRAIYEGRIDLKEAMAECSRSV